MGARVDEKRARTSAAGCMGGGVRNQLVTMKFAILLCGQFRDCHRPTIAGGGGAGTREKSEPSCATTRSTRLRGVAEVELEEATESLTTADLACSNLRLLRRDEFVVETLVRPLFMIQVDNTTPISTDSRNVIFPWHPWCGRSVTVYEVLTRDGQAVCRCGLDEERSRRSLEIPTWMFD